MDEENKSFIDFIASEIGEEIFIQNKLSIHFETGNIYYKNLKTNESIYDFLLQQHDKTKQFINVTPSFNDSFSNYIKEFLDDLDSRTFDRFDMSANKSVKYLFYGFIKTTDHRPTDPTTTYHLPIDPPTTYPSTHQRAIVNLRQNRNQILNIKTFIIIYILITEII